MTKYQAMCDYPAPLVALDHVVELSAGKIVTRKALRADEVYFRGHYPHFPIFPGVFILEAVSQAAKRYLAEFDAVGYLRELCSARLLAPLRPGEVLVCECQCEFTSNKDQLKVAAVCRNDRGLVAKMKLVFEADGRPKC